MTSGYSINYRFSVESPADANHVQLLNNLMSSSPNPMEMKYTQGSTPYTGLFQVRTFDGIKLSGCRIDSPAGSNTLFSVARTRSHIARNRSLEFNLCIWLGGDDNRLKIDGREHVMQTGDFTVMNTDVQFSVQALNRGHGCTLTLPASWDRIGDTRLEDVFGRLYKGGERHYNGLVSYVRHLRSHTDALDNADISAQLYDVIALALNPRAKGEHHTGLLALILNYIDTHCIDPDIDPAKIAAVFDISVRHLHRLFAASATSFTEYLIEQRLALAKHILADTRYQQQTILAIALRCGFNDINHFGRRFRIRFGSTPGEFRRAHC